MGSEAGAGWRNRIVGEGEEVPAALIPHEGNWRQHPKFQQDALSGVLDDLGWIQRIVVNVRPDGTKKIIDGHLRVELALSRNEPVVPVVYVSLSEEEESLALATIDPISALAGTDKRKLNELMSGIQARTAQTAAFLSDLARRHKVDWRTLDNPETVDHERGGVVNELWRVSPGDVWAVPSSFGEPHLIMCASAYDPAAYQRLTAQSRPDMVFADPPYDLGDTTWFDVLVDHTQPDCHLFVMYSDILVAELAIRHRKLFKRFFAYNQKVTWISSQHIPCNLIVTIGEFRKGKNKFVNLHDAFSNYLEFSKASNQYEDKGHRHSKPLAFITQFIEHYTKSGEVVFDPFMGSGSTLIAAERCGRRCLGVELDPDAIALQLERYVALGFGDPYRVE